LEVDRKVLNAKRSGICFLEGEVQRDAVVVKETVMIVRGGTVGNNDSEVDGHVETLEMTQKKKMMEMKKMKMIVQMRSKKRLEQILMNLNYCHCYFGLVPVSQC